VVPQDGRLGSPGVPGPCRCRCPGHSPAAGRPVPRCPRHAGDGTAARRSRRGLPRLPRRHAIAPCPEDGHSPACGPAAHPRRLHARSPNPCAPHRPAYHQRRGRSPRTAQRQYARHNRHPAGHPNPAAPARHLSPGRQVSWRSHVPLHLFHAGRTSLPPRSPPPLPSGPSTYLAQCRH
jgi:hypothetical protein